MSLLSKWVWGDNKPVTPASVQPAKKTVFLHLPKTAGTTFHQILLNGFPAGTALTNWEREGNLGTDPSRYQFISGHFDFSYLEKHKVDANVVTFLREPLRRTISHFYFLQQDFLLDLIHEPSEKYGAKTLPFTQDVLQRARSHDLASFLKKEEVYSRMLLGNNQTKYLGGFDEHKYQYQVGDLARAIQNLESCFFVGISEKMDESVKRFCLKMGWPTIMPGRAMNTNENKVKFEDQPEEVIEGLRAINDLDIPLYQHAMEIFDRRGVESALVPFQMPDAGNYTLDQAILGEGWHLREKIGSTWIAWSGPERTSWLELSTRVTKEATITCHFHFVMHGSVLEGLKLSINENPMDFTVLRLKDRIALRARVPAEVMQNSKNRLRVAFVANKVISAREMDPTSPDKRKLGFALELIRLEESSGKK